MTVLLLRNITDTPVKHVIVIIGENRTFDNIYATYVPEHGTVIKPALERNYP
jgi:phospholipase C